MKEKEERTRGGKRVDLGGEVTKHPAFRDVPPRGRDVEGANY